MSINRKAIKNIILTASVVLSVQAVAAEKQDKNIDKNIPMEELNKEWKAHIVQYAKEMVSAVYAEKRCQPYKIKMNEKYFTFGITPESVNRPEIMILINYSMMQTRQKLDDAYNASGRDNFCKGFVELIERQYANSPEKPITHK